MALYSRIPVLLAAAISFAAVPPGTADDEKLIRSLIADFNAAVQVNNFDRIVALFTRDGDYTDACALPMPAGRAIRRMAPKRLPWDERTALTMKVEKIGFISATKAWVDAVQSDYAPSIGLKRTWLCHFVVVRDGQTWRIASYREAC